MSNLECGRLTLVDAKTSNVDKARLFDINYLEGKSVGVRTKAAANGDTLATNGHTVSVAA